ncbi:RND family efflux transporter MFP subunit [Paraburkholderia bannensis]|uniref:RND family efflux transporter MFP subunit n=1 Tax=Paraburkholderia bannensis TaxID=765414 RepID=A0A7W9WSH2_9BURK|nr:MULTISPECIES: efflux RND transporter periplasmic adaptor subunit [Paraburkholderia]MBB3257292.1 RND family efflux transporter MFP subunit [Paraburkholderia sp. WP4_3_2]MBB6102312.1 RND family efflux transporter MFP subunit [Paraburkholderia bannensis]
MFNRKIPMRAAAYALCAAGALAAGGAFLVAHAAHADASATGDSADSAPTVAVQTARVVRENVSQRIVAYGVVAAAGANAATVSLPYVARVTRVLVQPGQRVGRGAPLFVVQADPAAVIALTQAQSAATLARGELARTQALYRDNLATQSQLAAAQKALDDAMQAIAAQNASGIAAGAKTITAPAAGAVAQVSAAPGDQVQAGAALAQLVGANAGDAKTPNVSLGVEAADAALIHPGDRIVLHALAASQPALQAPGQIAMVGASVDAQSQLVDVGASVPLAGTAFLPGTRVRADIDAQPGDWWSLPRAAVLQDSRGQYVYQVVPGNKAHRVAVTVKVEHGDIYGVDGALDAARPLVVSGNYELEDGMTVRVANAAQAKPGGAR